LNDRGARPQGPVPKLLTDHTGGSAAEIRDS
jgi:hypothetical protein